MMFDIIEILIGEVPEDFEIIAYMGAIILGGVFISYIMKLLFKFTEFFYK